MNRGAPSWLGLPVAGFMLAMVGVSAPARADNVVITYSAAGQTAPNFSAICANSSICDYGTEDFSTWTGQSPYATNFTNGAASTYSVPAGVSFNGVYSAGAGTYVGSQWVSEPQNQYGGINGANYSELYGQGSGTLSNYNLALSTTGVPGANYFGIWISALDPFNDLKLYDGSTLVAEFNSAQLLAQLGNCNDPSANAYCGNPTPQFKNQDNGELFAYVNVFDLSGYITNVQFYDGGNTGFESSNDAVAYVDPLTVVGTTVNGTSVPEPASMALLATGLLGVGFAWRRTASRRPSGGVA